MIRGENNCAQHRSKGTTLDTDEGETTPKVLCKGPEKHGRKQCSSMRPLGFFSSTRSAHDSAESKLHDTRERRNKINNKEEVTSKFEL